MKHKECVHPISAPVGTAMVFICEKCGRRAGDSDKNPSHRLASKFKRLTKHELGKGEVRIALTSCMDICPDDRIAISIQPTDAARGAAFCVSDIKDLDASSEALLGTLRQVLQSA